MHYIIAFGDDNGVGDQAIWLLVNLSIDDCVSNKIIVRLRCIRFVSSSSSYMQLPIVRTIYVFTFFFSFYSIIKLWLLFCMK